MIVVSYYTPSYRLHVGSLSESLRRLGLKFRFTELPDQGSWIKNVHYKPFFVQQCLQTHRDDALFVDVDSEFRRYPDQSILELESGIAVVSFEGQLLSGTVFAKRDGYSESILELWSQYNLDNPDVIDDVNLQRLYSEHPDMRSKIKILNPAYCWIESEMQEKFPYETPIVFHHCAGGKEQWHKDWSKQ